MSEGLDSALNIERESFNHVHPHSVFITKWLHNALRQLATAQKREASEVRKSSRAQRAESNIDNVRDIAADVWASQSDDEASSPPAVEFSETGNKTLKDANAYSFSAPNVLGALHQQRVTGKAAAHRDILEEKLKAIVQVLASYELLDKLTKKKQEELLRALYRVLEAGEE